MLVIDASTRACVFTETPLRRQSNRCYGRNANLAHSYKPHEQRPRSGRIFYTFTGVGEFLGLKYDPFTSGLKGSYLLLQWEVTLLRRIIAIVAVISLKSVLVPWYE